MQISNAALWLITFWDIVTNVALIAFPIIILTNAQLPHRVKTRAAIRFAVISLIIWISLIRSASSYSFVGIDRTFWLHFWGSIQNSTFIVVGNGLAIRSQLQSREPTRHSLTTLYTGPIRSTLRPISRVLNPSDIEIDEIQNQTSAAQVGTPVLRVGFY